VAEKLGRAGAGRAVGQALTRNPLPIIVPCHRVVAKDGGLGGYSGGLAKKRYLLRLESAAT
jgi:methylated-DNA-[protein]-cysteine S-methyltransferase